MYRRRYRTLRRKWRRRRYFGRVGAVSKFSAPAAMNKLSNRGLQPSSDQELVIKICELNRAVKTLYLAYRKRVKDAVTLKTYPKWRNNMWNNKEKRDIYNEVKQNSVQLKLLRYACNTDGVANKITALVGSNDAAAYCLATMASCKSKGSALQVLLTFKAARWAQEGNKQYQMSSEEVWEALNQACAVILEVYKTAVPMVVPTI